MNNILRVQNLKTFFYTHGAVVRAVDGVTFDIGKNKVFGIVGESGSGKTMTALSILRLIAPPGKIMGGRILFDGTDLLVQDEEYLRTLRGSKIALVFQEPSSALNPVFTAGYQISEAALVHQKLTLRQAQKLAVEFLDKVHIPDPEKVYHYYPHQLSGGTKQRIMIAMALINNPELVILDEPTTALDVTIQAQILDLLEEIIAREKISILFISHDFGIISRMCSEVAVMYKGKIVESGSKEQVLNSPREEYTKRLLQSVKALA